MKRTALVALLALTGCSELTAPNGQFFCIDDDQITEHHVGVTSASIRPSGVWLLRYTDVPEQSVYLQRPGETCYATKEPAP